MARHMPGNQDALYRGVVHITYAEGHYAAGQSQTLYLGPFLTEAGAAQAVAYQTRGYRSRNVTATEIQRVSLSGGWERKQPAAWTPVEVDQVIAQMEAALKPV